MDYRPSCGPLPVIPDHLTIPQFIFDYESSTRPLYTGAPWLIEDSTGRKISKETLRARTAALATTLASKFHIGKDDVVLIFSRNHIGMFTASGYRAGMVMLRERLSESQILPLLNYPVAIWAIHSLGAVVSSANPDFTIEELVYQLNETRAKLIFAYPDALSTTKEAAIRVGIPSDRVIAFNPSPADLTVDALISEGLAKSSSFREFTLTPGEARTKLAFLIFSSGTTGRPKAVAIPHFSVIANVIQLATWARVNEEYAPWSEIRYRPGDVMIGVLPLYHIYGLVVNMHFSLFSGMPYVPIAKFNLVEMLKSIVRHRIAHLLLVPPQILLLLKHPAVKDHPVQDHIRSIMCGAAPLSQEINNQLFAFLPNAHIGQAYGMTETCTAVTGWSITQKRGVPGGAGQFFPGVVARVLKEDGTPAGFGERGELYIKSPSNALRYANNAQASKETFVDGWVRTGDEVYIDKNMELFVVDRLKEIMKVKGFQVAPAELEGCILDHSDVSDACVVGVPDDYSGEVPLAFVALTADAVKRSAGNAKVLNAIKASVIKHVAEDKISYKHLAGGVEVVEVIPRNPSGKLLRRLLREKAKQLVNARGSGSARAKL